MRLNVENMWNFHVFSFKNFYCKKKKGNGFICFI